MADTKLWTTVHPLPIRNTSFVWVPYWVFDLIVDAKEEGKDWRDIKNSKYQVELDTLKAAQEEYGDVDFIESRNGYVHKLSKYTPETPEEPEETQPVPKDA